MDALRILLEGLASRPGELAAAAALWLLGAGGAALAFREERRDRAARREARSVGP